MPQDVTGDRIAAVLERLADNQPPQEIGYAHPKYQQHLKDAGYFAEFPKPVYQNGYEAPAQGVSAETIRKTAALKDGTYISGRVTVAHDQKGGIHLLYKNSTPDDRMRNKDLFSSFDDLINKITAEMQATGA